MSYELTKSDYVKILNHYSAPTPKSYNLLKEKAEDIISEKLCSCIKKVSPINEPRAIGVCTRSIVNRKHMKRGNFRCKKPRLIELSKTKKRIFFPSKNRAKTNKNK